MYGYKPKSKAAQPPSVEVLSFRKFVGDRKKLLMVGAAWRDIYPRIPRSWTFNGKPLAQRSKTTVLSMSLK